MDELLIAEVREIGLKAMKNLNWCLSVDLELDGHKFTVHNNGDVDAEDGFCYYITKSAKNGLLTFEMGA